MKPAAPKGLPGGMKVKAAGPKGDKKQSAGGGKMAPLFGKTVKKTESDVQPAALSGKALRARLAGRTI